jgi:L-alanine-DL-glutamate epimerase-like enolase superfamily enzyme
MPDIRKITASAYKIPTDTEESDGTLKWESTTLVLVEIEAGSEAGLGYSYSDAATVKVIEHPLAQAIVGVDAMDIPACWSRMMQKIRNLGQSGIAARAVSAVDNALWDLKAKLCGVSLGDLLGRCQDSIPAYGSGGFTSYPPAQLEEQLGGWAREGFSAVKMKVGREPEKDVERVKAARRAIGPGPELFVDGAYEAKQALKLAEAFAEQGVTWFEEPVSSDDLEGLRLIRERAPAGMRIAAGEYGDHPNYFERMTGAGAVDVLQADATRCGGITGFLKAAALCEAKPLPFSAHCAPALHAHAALPVPNFSILEYFYDHQRIEKMLFDGVPRLKNGRLWADPGRRGIGLVFKRQDAAKFQI